MKKSTKIAMVIALSCIALGAVISLGTLAAIHFDFERLNTMKFETNTYDVSESFSNIHVEGAECTVRLVPSQTDACRVVCTEGDRISHTVTVDQDTLTVTRTDTRRWYEHIGVYWGGMDITVYLPARAYENLSIKSASGEIRVPGGFSFSQAELRSASGDIEYAADTEHGLTLKTASGDLTVSGLTAGSLEARSTSGEVAIRSVTVRGDLVVETVSGEIELEDASAQALSVQSTSGNLELTNVSTAAPMKFHAVSGDVGLTDVIAAAHMDIETVSGEIHLERSDAETLWIKSTSGDVSGSLLTDKLFITHTTSGDVRVPNSSTSGGTCEVTTTSGEIHLNYVN